MPRPTVQRLKELSKVLVMFSTTCATSLQLSALFLFLWPLKARGFEAVLQLIELMVQAPHGSS